MRNTFAKLSFVLAAFAALSASLFAQTQVNPATQIRWPAVTGSGAPMSGCPITTTAATTSGSTLVTVASSTDLAPGQTATGAGVATGSVVDSVVGTSVTLSLAATATGSGVAVDFYPYGMPYTDTANNAQYVCASAGWTQIGAGSTIQHNGGSTNILQSILNFWDSPTSLAGGTGTLDSGYQAVTFKTDTLGGWAAETLQPQLVPYLSNPVSSSSYAVLYPQTGVITSCSTASEGFTCTIATKQPFTATGLRTRSCPLCQANGTWTWTGAVLPSYIPATSVTEIDACFYVYATASPTGSNGGRVFNSQGTAFLNTTKAIPYSNVCTVVATGSAAQTFDYSTASWSFSDVSSTGYTYTTTDYVQPYFAVYTPNATPVNPLLTIQSPLTLYGNTIGLPSYWRVLFDTGSANAYVATSGSFPTSGSTTSADPPGDQLTLQVLNSNTGASTFSLNGQTPVAIVKASGGSLVALASGDISSSVGAVLENLGTEWLLLNPLMGSGSTGLSGMTAGQVPIAATATTATSSKALAGSGAGIATEPTASTANQLVMNTDTAGTLGPVPGVTSDGANGLTVTGNVKAATSQAALTDKGGQVWNVKSCGAKGDGVTDDTAAVNACIADAVAATATAGGTATVFFPSGTYLGCFTVIDGQGLRFQGAGELSTVLEGNGNCPAMQINGLWYSSFRDMSFRPKTALTGNNGVLSIDGNYDGTHHQTSQFITFDTIDVSGAAGTTLSPYAITVCTQNGALQTCQGSNLTFINTACIGASTACYYQYGYNALSVQWIGGDVQWFHTNGMNIYEGGIQIIGTTFESTVNCLNIVNGGVDVDASGNSAGATITLDGVRSEDYTIFTGHYPNINGLTQSVDHGSWTASTPYALNDGYITTGSDSRLHLYCVSTAGTSGSSAPTWPATGTVTDGTVTWTTTPYNAISQDGTGWFNPSGNELDGSAGISYTKSSFSLGNLANLNTQNFTPVFYPLTSASQGILAQAASGNAYLDLVAYGTPVTLFSTPSGLTDPLSGVVLPTGEGIYPGNVNEDNFWLGSGLKENRYGLYQYTTGVPVSAQTKPTITGCGSIVTQTGGGTSGTFVAASTTCTPSLTGMPYLATANGYACTMWDRTSAITTGTIGLPVGAAIGNVSSSASGATWPALTVTSGDVMAFSCSAY